MIDSTEQTSPQASVDAAMAAMERKIFGDPEPEESTPEAAADETQDTAEEQDSEEEQTQAAADSIDFETDDGEVVKVPAKLKDYLERSADYTRKNQERAALAKQAEDRLQYAEAREKLGAEVMEEVAQMRAAESDLQRYQAADWAALYEANPGQALKLQQDMRALEQKVSSLRTAIHTKAARLGEALQQHQAEQWKLAQEGARSRIGSLTESENVAMAHQAQALGFQMAELQGRFADPRVLHAIYKAAKWDALQASKGSAAQKTAKAGPFIKPGASDPVMSAKMQNLNWSKAMKNAKTPGEKRALAEQRMAKFFGT